MSGPSDPVHWTLADAAQFLRPTVTEEQLRRIFTQLPGLNPVGKRHLPGQMGRPADLFDMDEVIEWHHLNRRWLVHQDAPVGTAVP